MATQDFIICDACHRRRLGRKAETMELELGHAPEAEHVHASVWWAQQFDVNWPQGKPRRRRWIPWLLRRSLD
jgi:hypothetical protein